MWNGFFFRWITASELLSSSTRLVTSIPSLIDKNWIPVFFQQLCLWLFNKIPSILKNPLFSFLFFGFVYIENCHSWTGVFIGPTGGFWLCKQEISVLYPCCFESVHHHNLRYRLQFGALKWTWTPALGHTVGSVSSSMLQLWTFFRNEWKSTVKVSSLELSFVMKVDKC